MNGRGHTGFVPPTTLPSQVSSSPQLPTVALSQPETAPTSRVDTRPVSSPFNNSGTDVDDILDVCFVWMIDRAADQRPDPKLHRVY